MELTLRNHKTHGTQQWASCQIRKIAGCACAGNAGNVFPRRRFQRKLLVSDPGIHHGTCVTHVPWCMSGSLTCGDGENVPGIPGACAPAISRIWQEAHDRGIGEETEEYQQLPYTTLHHNPLLCWKENKFPNLVHYAWCMLAIPGTSASSECIFAFVADVLTTQRPNLSQDNKNISIFLKKNMKLEINW